MKPRARRWTLFASAGLFLAMLGSAALLWLGRPFQVRTLPDGSRVRLERVAIERVSQRFVGSGWQQYLWDLTGRRLLLFGHAIMVTRGQDALSLEVTGSGAKRPKRFDTGVLLDEHDCVFSGWQEDLASIPGRISTAGKVEVSFPAFPRHGGVVRAGFVADNQPVLFDVPVPDTGKLSGWTPPPYPIRAGKGDLEFALTRIAPARLPERLRPRAYFEVREQGRRVTDWAASSIRVSDGTGNSNGLTELAVEADGSVVFPGLCTRESAWKLETWFAPVDPAHAAPDLEWTARNVELAGAGKVALSGQTADQSGIAFELVGTAGAGDAEWRPGLRMSNNTPVVRARATLPADAEGAVLTLVKVTDPKGRLLLPRPRSGRVPSSAATWREYTGRVVEHDFPLRPPVSTGRVNVTFRVHKMRKVDFLARP